ncbi:MAG: DUF362 domain-containing protein [Candidatus Margulisbacteria bacterium]|nr:DUF362 domain-containing protein [Candidatus Margulisiibacteriota bacterium]
MSQVFFTKDPDQVAKLFDAAQLGKNIAKDDFVALKIHFGERGNNAYVKSDRAKPVVKKVKALKAKPFWLDSNTLYKGSRSNTLDHLQTAFDHGYTAGKTGAHVLIADGLDGLDHVVKTDALIAISHFKGHELTGFGGAIKNLGMGLASRADKLEQHSDCDNCKAKPNCRKKENIESCWVGSSDSVQEKMAEYAAGVATKLKNKTAYINFITDVSENCDCYDFNSEPIIPDVGILASFDPVALDQACVDMVNKTDGRIKSNDKFRELWPNVDWSVQLKHAEKIGLGFRKYELKEI